MSLAVPTATSAKPGDLFAGYSPIPGVYDEMFAAPGEPRPHWRRFAESLNALGRVELTRRCEQARRMLRENGVTYNVHGDPDGRDRPWDLDPLPLLLPAAEWTALSSGLVQRAQLLNLILADLYGPQRLLREGDLPAELVFGHPGFLRSCYGWGTRRNFLDFYAAHLARAPHGRWAVLADRTQAPAGAGFAVENRIVVSRLLPNLFQESEVQRLASFFIAVRETLRNLADRRDNPRIVLLSPGPANPAYFEDAYLARYLGYALVEGGDLTVRDSRVYLKTLGGLIPVDVIVRRIFDDDCDPLELAAESTAGVPGLLQAARAGAVAVANALGSNLLEAPAFMAYLPDLCRRLLGEELQLPSVGTWWCGQRESLEHVIGNLDHLVIKPSYSVRDARPIFGEQLSIAEKCALVARIRAQPRNFVAQEILARSTAPVWTTSGMQPWRMAVRAFLVSSGDSYQVMPGALTRVSATLHQLGESSLGGQGSKDVWILSDGPVAPVSLLHPAGEPIALRRSGNDLPSRVADNLFWLGRHVERAEGSVRLLRSVVSRLTSDAQPEQMPELGVLLHALSDQGQIRADFVIHADGRRTPVWEPEILAFVFEEGRAGSLRSTLRAVHRGASLVRDRISIDSWRILNRLDQDFQASYPLGVVPLSEVLSMLNQMIIHLSAFSGLGMESMTRGPGWRFLDMGRRLERGLYMLSLINSTLTARQIDENNVLEALLEIADSSMTYRSRYLTSLQVRPVLDLLMTDESNPRSVGFQLLALVNHVENLPRDSNEPLLGSEQRLIMSAMTGLRLADIDGLCTVDKDGARRSLERLLHRLAAHLRNLSDGVTHKYLVHAGPSRQMGEVGARSGA